MTTLTRRTFLQYSGATATAFVLGVYNDAMAAGTPAVVRLDGAPANGIELNAWVIIDTAGQVTLVTHRAEMGQGVYQALPQILAEELEVDLDDVNVAVAPGDSAKYGNQITGGSSSVRANYKNLLLLAATAREMLIGAAADHWSVAKDDCYAVSGHVVHRPSGRKGNYGEFIEKASQRETPADVKLKNVADYKLIRKPLPRKDTPLKVNGSAIFGIDKRLDGMLFAAVERSPRLHGKVVSVDGKAALQIPGVRKIVRTRSRVHHTYREGVAVVATSTWAAFAGKKALKIKWDDSGFEHIDSDELFHKQQTVLRESEGLTFRSNGDPSRIIANADETLDVIYQTPYQAHSCMEPLNCTAWYQPDKLEIWGPIQAPEWVRDNLAEDMRLDREKITVNLTFLGGGFGRKAFMDYPHEAAQVSRDVGAPVQVVWTREDDTSQGPFRPGVSYRCEGVVNDGRIAALKLRLAGQNNDHWRVGDETRGKPNRSASEGFLKPYFDTLEHISIADVPFEAPVPVMWWRSVYASTNGFAYESFMDELAVAAKADPLEFRRAHLQDKRLHRLIDKMAAVSGWADRGRGYGVAITECFGSTVGQVVKVSRRDAGSVGVDRVWAVIDCGWYVNPDTIRAQIEGAIVMALGAAVTHEITFRDGMAQQQNFHNYPMPRLPEVPPVAVHIMENGADAGGVGEPGLPAFAPALANVIFDLTGQRIRKLPLSLGDIRTTEGAS